MQIRVAGRSSRWPLVRARGIWIEALPARGRRRSRTVHSWPLGIGIGSIEMGICRSLGGSSKVRRRWSVVHASSDLLLALRILPRGRWRRLWMFPRWHGWRPPCLLRRRSSVCCSSLLLTLASNERPCCRRGGLSCVLLSGSRPWTGKVGEAISASAGVVRGRRWTLSPRPSCRICCATRWRCEV